MCWAVHIDGEEYSSRNALEARIGYPATYRDDGPRMEADHCLCPLDVPATLINAGYWVRSWLPGDPRGEPGDWHATEAPHSPSGPAAQSDTGEIS